MKQIGLMLVASAIALAGCDSGAQAVAAKSRGATAQKVAEGERLYQANCAECHGKAAQGAFDWRRRLPDGSFPPPPLNGSGHAWHHPKPMLHNVIKHGSPGGGKMPAWKDKLNDAQIEAVIAWFQSLWPEPIYEAWAERDARAKVSRR